MCKMLRLIFKRLRRYGPFVVRQVLRCAPRLSRCTITQAEVVDGHIVYRGYVVSNHAPQGCRLTVRKFRDEQVTYDCPLDLTPHQMLSTRQRVLRFCGFQHHQFTVCLTVPWGEMPSSIFGLGYKAQDTVTVLKLHQTCVQILTDDAAGRTYCLFNDPAVNVPRLEMYHFGQSVLSDLRRAAGQPYPDELQCIIGEYTNTARDNGRALFETLRGSVQDIHVKYVIEAENIDHYEVDQPGVLTFGSPAHLHACIQAKVCAFTHHRSYVYPHILRLLAEDRYWSTTTLFLQHGIIALKRSIVTHYHHDQIKYDGFCVSSEHEKAIIVKHFGYPPSKVHITGLPRFDLLLEKARSTDAIANQVLIFPTWRAGFEKMTTDEVAQTIFFRQWRSALVALRAVEVRVHIILHPMLRRHANLFALYADQMSPAASFQDELVQSCALVTDYSSVSFDALFVRKPVFLFQFNEGVDAPMQNGFINVLTQSPGQISHTVEALVAQILQTQADGWTLQKPAQNTQYFKYDDANNTMRVVKTIRQIA